MRPRSEGNEESLHPHVRRVPVRPRSEERVNTRAGGDVREGNRPVSGRVSSAPSVYRVPRYESLPPRQGGRAQEMAPGRYYRGGQYYPPPGLRGAAPYMGRRRRRNPFPFIIGGVVGLVAAGLIVAALYLNVFKGPSSGGSLPAQGVASATSVSNAGSVSTPTVQGPKFDPKATPVGLFDVSSGAGGLSVEPGVNKGQFNLPRGIALDANGNFFVADTQNFRIQKFDKAGKFVMAFGSKGTQRGLFNSMSEDAVGTGPGGLVVDKAGNLYVADTWNHRIQKFDNNGKYLTAWGSFLSLADASAAADPEKDSKFWGPRGVAVGPDSNIYVTDTGNKRVLIFDPNGKYLRKIDSGLTKAKFDAKYPFDKPGELNEPIGIAVDSAGAIYVADTNNSRIQKFDKDGKPVAQWPVPAGSWRQGPYLEPFLALDNVAARAPGAGGSGSPTATGPEGQAIYATAPTGKTVLKFSPTGQLLGQKNSQGTAKLDTPTGITVGPDGTVYVVDTGTNSVVNLGKIP